MRIVDLFCGIGGVAQAVRGQDDVTLTAAIDIDLGAISVYQLNHGITPRCATLESIREIPDADLWWLSPPCQPYTKRGLRRQELDPRSRALAHLLELIRRDRPAMVALENVPAFAGSNHHHRLTAILQSGGYSVRNDVLCPTQWGVPMRRERFYLRARRDGRPIPPVAIAEVDTENVCRRSLAHYLDAPHWDDESLRVSRQQIEQFGAAMDIVDAGDRSATAACFTGAYGRSPIRSGSYLFCPQREIVRRFSATEIGRLMGFGGDFQWPKSLDHRTRYRLLGNSLPVPIVRALLQSLAD